MDPEPTDAEKRTTFLKEVQDLQEEYALNVITQVMYEEGYKAAHLKRTGKECTHTPPAAPAATQQRVVTLGKMPDKLLRATTVQKPEKQFSVSWNDPTMTSRVCSADNPKDCLEGLAQHGFDGSVRNSAFTSLKCDASGKWEDGNKKFFKVCTAEEGCPVIACCQQVVTVPENAGEAAVTSWVGVYCTKFAHGTKPCECTFSGIKQSDLLPLPEYAEQQVQHM